MNEPQKPVVTSDEIHVKKRSKAENFFSNFISDLIVNVVIPAVERTANNLVSDTFDATKRAMLSAMNFDSKNPSPNHAVSDSPVRVSYNDYYNRFNQGGPGTFTPIVNDYAYNDITFETRGKAEYVRSILIDICRRNKFVTVGDYYGLCGIPTAPTDFTFGWINLDSVQVIMDRRGFKIKLPKAMPIDR